MHHMQRLGRPNRHMDLWPLAFKSHGPFLKSTCKCHCSNGKGKKKENNMGIFVSDATFDSMNQ